MFATIDIGSNSVLLLVGEPQPDGSVRVVRDIANVTRISEGMGCSGEISEAACQRTLKALSEYQRLCKEEGCKDIAAVGTAALRNASNASKFLDLARSELGIEVEVISPEREATLSYAASARDFGQDIVVADIGGCSTEFISQKRDRAGSTDGVNIVSLPLGCVSLTEKFIRSDPTSARDLHALQTEVRGALEDAVDQKRYARPNDLTLVATAGTATTLMAIHLKLEPYDAGRVHGEKLRVPELRDIIEELMSKTVDERKRMPGLLPARADVILSGAALLHELMNYLGYAEATISDRGVKWGLFYERFCA